MSVGHVVVIAALTFFALGALRRAFWFARWRRTDGCGGRSRHGRWGHRRGYGSAWFARAIARTVGATAEQEVKLAQIVDRLRGDRSTMREARSKMIDALVELLPGEALDEAALGELATSANAAYEQVRGDVLQAFVELHRTLTPVQRQQVAAWVRRRDARWV